MVIPFIAATMRDVFLTVPPVFKESAYGVGCTTWEVMRSIVLPYTRVSVVGGIMLGLGRALGRDDGRHLRHRQHQPHQPPACSGPATPSPPSWRWSSGGHGGSLKLASLLALGFVLFVISFIVLTISRMLLRPRMRA